MITDDFQVKLESALQWELWEIELNSHLDIIIGANDIAFSYVIQEYNIQDHSKEATLEDKARLSVPHTGNRYLM